MDDISLIGHMSGQGEVVADKLRQAGYTTLQKIIEEEPSVLAESTGLKPNIVGKIINSAKALSRTRPATKEKAEKKVKKKVVLAAAGEEKVESSKAAAKTKSAKKVKKPARKPKETITEKPIFDPLQRVAHSFEKEHEIAEGTALKFVDVVTKSPGVREKILRKAMGQDKFRERFVHYLARKLT